MTRPAANSTRRNGTVRCAIYTRKSSEEGLEQEFNSLQAQREACEAFINSQRHEGWVCLPKAYNDGGFSGATIDRHSYSNRRANDDLVFGEVPAAVADTITRATSKRPHPAELATPSLHQHRTRRPMLPL